nr:hypothetical protein [Tanacetum cinerariifolium]
MFKQLHINITLADALILIPKYQKMLKALLSNKEKHLELANTHLNENCSTVILKKLPEKLGDRGKFLIPCGFTRDVFVLVGKFTFPADFFIVDYKSDPRVLLILGRPLLRTARALIDVHGEEMILRDGDERLTLNMRHDTLSYSNQPHKESINMINIYNDSYEYYLKDLFTTNHLSGNPTFSSHTDLTSPEVINPLSGNTTYSSPDHLLEELADELALITFPSGNDYLPFDIESNLREMEYLLNHDPTKEIDSILEDSIDEGNPANPNNDLVDTIPEMFTDVHTLDYSSLPLYDDVDDDLVELESDNDDDLSDSKEDKIKESKLLIDEIDPPRSSDFFHSPEYESVLYEDFSEVDDLPSTNNEDKMIKALGARGVVKGSSLGVVRIMLCGGIERARVVSRVVVMIVLLMLKEVMKKTLEQTFSLFELQGLSSFDWCKLIELEVTRKNWSRIELEFEDEVFYPWPLGSVYTHTFAWNFKNLSKVLESESGFDIVNEEGNGNGFVEVTNDTNTSIELWNEDGANLFVKIEDTVKTDCRKGVAKI